MKPYVEDIRYPRGFNLANKGIKSQSKIFAIQRLDCDVEQWILIIQRCQVRT